MASAEVRLSEVVALIEALDRERLRPLIDDDRRLQQLLANLAARGYVLQEARHKGFHKRPEMAARMARARLQSHYASYITHHVTPDAGYPDEAASRAFYRENSARFKSPAAYRLAQLFVADPGARGQASPQARRAGELAKQARTKAADFAALAAQHSEHSTSAAKGGEIGWAERDKLVPEIAAAVGGARPGDVVGPVHTAQGWHVIKVLDERPSSVRPYAEVRDAIRQVMRSQRTREEERRFLQALIDKDPIEVDAARLEKLRASL
jgi:peptidylprolyl isomerase